MLIHIKYNLKCTDIATVCRVRIAQVRSMRDSRTPSQLNQSLVQIYLNMRMFASFSSAR